MTPYSCKPTTRFATGSFSSSVLSISRHVFGSGTVIVGVMPNSLSTASGFGPRTTDLISLTAAKKRARSTCRSTCCDQDPRADARHENHDVDPARDEPIRKIDGRLIAFERHFAHRRADERHAAALGDHVRHFIRAATFERRHAQASK